MLVVKTPLPRVLARLSLATHDHLRAKRRDLAGVQTIKIEFSSSYTTGNTNHSLFSSLPLRYAGSPKVPPRVFGPLGPKTLRGQLIIQRFVSLIHFPTYNFSSGLVANGYRHQDRQLLHLVSSVSDRFFKRPAALLVFAFLITTNDTG